MTRRNPILSPHPKACRKLVRLYVRCGRNCYTLGKELEVSPVHIWNNLKKGTEPKRNDLRKKLFLSHKKTPEELEQMRRKNKELPEYIKKWRHLSTEERNRVIQQYITWRSTNGNATKKDAT